MPPQNAPITADIYRPSRGRFRKILKIVLIVLIGLLCLTAIGSIAHAYRVKNQVPDFLADNETISQYIRGA